MKNKLLKILKSNNIDIEVLKNNNVCLMGGSILRLFMGLPLDTDLDFCFVDYESYKNVDDYFRKNFIFVQETPLTKSYRVNDLVAQLAKNKKFMGTYENIVSTFDFTISTGCFDFKDDKFRYSKTYFDDIKNKRLVYESDSHIGPLGSIRRADKYKKLGFKVDNKSFKKLYDIVKSTDEGDYLDKLKGVVKKVSWLRNEDVYPIVPNIDVFVNWLMDIKDHKYFDKFNYYLTGGFISWPEKTKDVDIIITKRDGQRTTLKELEELMVDMFDSAYDTHGFFLDTFYMRTPQWIADYPRDREVLKSVERKQLFLTITKYEDTGIDCKYRRYGLLNCAYTGSFTLRGIKPSILVERWVDLDSEYARWVDLRRIIKYYENDKKRNIEDFKEKFQEYSGY